MPVAELATPVPPRRETCTIAAIANPTYKSEPEYTGAWKDDNFHGQGTMIYPDGHSYIGGYANGEEQHGTMFYPNGKKYVGEFKNGKFHGRGYLTRPGQQSLIGDFRDGEFLD